MREKWEKKVEQIKEVYIYGAGVGARGIYNLLRLDGALDKFKGFIVTYETKNVNYFENYPVLPVDSIEDKSINIWVAVGAVYKDEVLNMLKEKGFFNVEYIFEFYQMAKIEMQQCQIVDTAKELFLLQHINNEFVRYDIIITLLAIECYYKNNEYGFELYKKNYGNESIEKLKSIIKKCEEADKNKYFEVLVDNDYLVVGNMECLAMALYCESKNVKIRFVDKKSDVNLCDSNWVDELYKNIENEMIKDKYSKIMLDKLNYKDDISKQRLAVKIKLKYMCKPQLFGRGTFYQSFPLLGLDGQRSTEFRIEKYELYDYLDVSKNVLDIGCNIGFFDMTIANRVESIMGIEYDEHLVDIANMVVRELDIDNVNIVKADFNEWVNMNKLTFDVVFSFAVHYWLKVTPQSYSDILYQLLNNNGYLFFESQNLNTIDIEFNGFVQALLDKGLQIVKEGKLNDDNIVERKYYIFKKVK